MIKNIIFDCGGVLTNCVPYEYVESLDLTREEKDLLFNAIYHSKVWEKSDLGLYPSSKEMIDDFVLENKEIEPLVRYFFKSDWMDFYYPYPVGQNFLIKLKKEGYKIYILSNYAHYGFEYCETHYDCFKYIDGKIVSADVGIIKPDPRIYELLISRFNLKKEECLFLDDRQINVDGALSVGLPAIVYHENIEEIENIIKNS